MRGFDAGLSAAAVLVLAACSGPAGPGPSASPQPIQSVLAVGSVVTGVGAVLTPPPKPVTRPYSIDCNLADTGWIGRCLILQDGAGSIAALTEQSQGSTGSPVAERDQVYVRQGDQWKLALTSSRQLEVALGGGSPRAVPANLGDNVNRMVFMFTAGDPNYSDALDVVDTGGRVVVHLALDKGKARAAPAGGLEVWSQATAGSAATYRHLVIRLSGSGWKVAVADMVPASELPADNAKQRNTF